jgi:hypothetical protein
MKTSRQKICREGKVRGHGEAYQEIPLGLDSTRIEINFQSLRHVVFGLLFPTTIKLKADNESRLIRESPPSSLSYHAEPTVD